MYTRRCLNCTLSSRSQSLELLVKDRLSANRSCVFHQHPLRPLLFLQRGLRRLRDVGPRLVGRNQSISKSIHICDLIITYFQSNDILILSLSLLFLSNPYIRRADIWLANRLFSSPFSFCSSDNLDKVLSTSRWTDKQLVPISIIGLLSFQIETGGVF